MPFTENDLIFPSKKFYENIKNLIILFFLFYIHKLLFFKEFVLVSCSGMRNFINILNKAHDQVENSINTIGNVKITETEPYSFINEFSAISQFYIQASVLENMNNTPIQKRFYDLAIRLWDLGVCPKET